MVLQGAAATGDHRSDLETKVVLRSMILVALVLPTSPATPIDAAIHRDEPSSVGFCVPFGPAYYTFELVTTKNIPGTGLAKGRAEVSVPGSSPFAVALTADGSYAYEVSVSLERMKVPARGRLVAWVTTREIDQVVRMGALDDNLHAVGSTEWNKFLVVVTLEADPSLEATMWRGPIVFRGMSRSGMMHTMVGHGALQQENCAAYGYGN